MSSVEEIRLHKELRKELIGNLKKAEKEDPGNKYFESQRKKYEEEIKSWEEV